MKERQGLFFSPYLVKNRYATIRKLKHQKVPDHYAFLLFFKEPEHLEILEKKDMDKLPEELDFEWIGLAENMTAGQDLAVSVAADMLKTQQKYDFSPYLKRRGIEV